MDRFTALLNTSVDSLKTRCHVDDLNTLMSIDFHKRGIWIRFAALLNTSVDNLKTRCHVDHLNTLLGQLIFTREEFG